MQVCDRSPPPLPSSTQALGAGTNSPDLFCFGAALAWQDKGEPGFLEFLQVGDTPQFLHDDHVLSRWETELIILILSMKKE